MFRELQKNDWKTLACLKSPHSVSTAHIPYQSSIVQWLRASVALSTGPWTCAAFKALGGGAVKLDDILFVKLFWRLYQAHSGGWQAMPDSGVQDAARRYWVWCYLLLIFAYSKTTSWCKLSATVVGTMFWEDVSDLRFCLRRIRLLFRYNQRNILQRWTFPSSFSVCLIRACLFLHERCVYLLNLNTVPARYVVLFILSRCGYLSASLSLFFLSLNNAVTDKLDNAS